MTISILFMPFVIHAKISAKISLLFHRTLKLKGNSETFLHLNPSYVQMPYLISSGDNDFSIFQVQMSFANANLI